MSLQDFQILSKLGEGAYSTVYKVKRISDQQLYALKRVKILNLSQKEKENSLNQIRILASIRHPNVIGYKEAFMDQGTKSLCMVMDFANNGDLSYRITEKKKQKQFFQETQIWHIFLQIVQGLKQLHSLRIFHRDIKSANVFLHLSNSSTLAKLGDMNVSKISQRGLCMTQTGTPYYASPQVWKDKPYDEKSDIWSLGCVLYEMITLKPPFRSEDMEGLYKKVTRGIYGRIPAQFSQDLSKMIRTLLQVNPECRPSCQQILKMPIVQKRLKTSVSEIHENILLLRTIRGGECLSELRDKLPKPNYEPLRVRNERGMKSLIDSIEEKTICEVQSLPIFEKEKKAKHNENSERVMLKSKNSINMLSRDRKKSEMDIHRQRAAEKISQIKHGSSNINGDLKLPKVQSRYQKCKQRLYKQNSLRTNKVFE